jgi:hypothetical protein
MKKRTTKAKRVWGLCYGIALCAAVALIMGCEPVPGPPGPAGPEG